MSSRRKKIKLTKAQVEALSLRNARTMIAGKDNLPSRGHKGNIWLPRLRRKISYRSGLERKILLAIDMFPLIIDIESEKLYIKYIWKGAVCHYVPDLLLKLTDGKVWLIEIKPASLIAEDRNQAKFRAAQTFCRQLGNHIRFGILTSEKDVQALLPTHNGVSVVEHLSQNSTRA